MTTLDWDYTTLADTYSERPNYADGAIDALIEATGLSAGNHVLDLGAGTGHLSLKLAARALDVTAVEPNARMREIGVSRTAGLANVHWIDAVMQDTGLAGDGYVLAAYGSSFGVADYEATLREAHRLLRPGGHIAALFNHRDLDDLLQRDIEALIHREVPSYSYGNRRQDQTEHMELHGLFGGVERFEVPFVQEQPLETWLAAWSSHATLARQAGERFPAVVAAIEELVKQRYRDTVLVPYTTRLWVGKRA